MTQPGQPLILILPSDLRLVSVARTFIEAVCLAGRLDKQTTESVGLALHEPPFVRDLDYELQAGDVHTVEPGLYEVGAGGIRWEDTGVVEDGGFRNFSSLPKSLDPQAYL